MLKDSNKLTDTLIQIIESLPDNEKRTIAEKITEKPSTKPIRRKAASKRKDSFTAMSDFLDALKPSQGRLPKNYKFNREEANER
jgi:hypothetical protein